MNHKIIQWNCHGIKVNWSELVLLMNLQLAFICLQETLLKMNNDIYIKSYKSYNHIYNTSHRASGGVSILISNDISQSKINLNTEFLAIVVKITLYKILNIYTLYIPPHGINKKELNNILQQLPTPYVLLSDFNSHNSIWGCKSTNQEAKHWKIFSIRINVFSTQNLKHILPHLSIQP